MDKFKEGDKVNIVNGLDIYRGRTGEVIEYRPKKETIYKVLVDLGDKCIWCRISDVELIEPEKAMRFNTSKAEFFDLPLLGTAEVAKVAAYGRAKYAKYNWKKEAPMSQYFDCALRHLMKYWYGQDVDSESKCHHLAHAAWNMLVALEKIQTGTQIDDRANIYPKEFVDGIEKLFELNDDQKRAVQEVLDKKESKG